MWVNVRGYETYVNKDGESPVTYEVPLRDVPVTFSNQMGTGQQVVIDPSLTTENDARGDLVGEPIPDQVTLDENGKAHLLPPRPRPASTLPTRTSPSMPG